MAGGESVTSTSKQLESDPNYTVGSSAAHRHFVATFATRSDPPCSLAEEQLESDPNYCAKAFSMASPNSMTAKA